ncbi:MAG: hypothetical protein ACYTBS_07425 [Planctomycetota bacterium]
MSYLPPDEFIDLYNAIQGKVQRIRERREIQQQHDALSRLQVFLIDQQVLVGDAMQEATDDLRQAYMDLLDPDPQGEAESAPDSEGEGPVG